jgi:hypothetical protein
MMTILAAFHKSRGFKSAAAAKSVAAAVLIFILLTSVSSFRKRWIGFHKITPQSALDL